MNITNQKIKWKFLLFIAAVFIGAGSLYYTNELVKKLSVEEKNKVELWAEATRLMVSDNTQSYPLDFLLKIISNNETVPVILADENDSILLSRNVLSENTYDASKLSEVLVDMKDQNEPIVIELPDNQKQYLYYSKSLLLIKLTYYPFIQLGVILLFIVVAYLAFSAARKAEQNQVWVGLSKETAHQLGTPTSSLMAWLQLLKDKNNPEDAQIIEELEKDVTRLSKITERFSKIGSTPTLEPTNITRLLHNSVSYLKSRTSDKVSFHVNNDNEHLEVPLNWDLFEWVVENICKNAVDAMDGKGEINISVTDHVQMVYIDIEDTGKGIAKSKYKTIFNPGYTTKQRGWGLGLTLTKRIIELYHNGRIFVHASEPNKGTTFRIVLGK